MINIKFLLKRMKDANYQGFIDSAKRVSKVNKKPWMVNLADCLFCTAKYGSGYIDYETFEMFNLGAKDRENILTISKNNAIFKKLNNLDYIKYFEDKAVFNEKFDKYLKSFSSGYTSVKMIMKNLRNLSVTKIKSSLSLLMNVVEEV